MSHRQPGFMKTLALRTLGPAAVGRLDYVFRPSLRNKWGGPMNGQAGRQRMCREILGSMQATAVVETGTFRGTTTEFLASFGVPVYSVEANPQYHAYSALRLRHLQDRVHLSLDDSRPFLRRLAADASIPRQSVFFYLDAHWDANLPLAEEITIIFAAWSEAVIMIDDFAVPGDDYKYDDYGPGSALNRDYIDALQRDDLAIYYPTLRGRDETGARRGCVVLCNDARTRGKLDPLSSLRPG